MGENDKDVSVVDRISTYAVDNTTLEDTEETQNLFYVEIVEDSEQEIELPDASEVIKINLI